MEKVTSADGTTIAYDRLGSGHPLILVGGALCDRHALRILRKSAQNRRKRLRFRPPRKIFFRADLAPVAGRRRAWAFV